MKDHIARFAVLVVGLSLTACASDGGFAGKDAPLDRRVTLERTCEAVKVADIAFQALVKAKPELIDANGLAVEAAIMETVRPICVSGFSGNMDEALSVALAAMVQVSALLQNWQKVPG